MFIGYMVHRLLSAALGRTREDDRDHYGKKRLDLVGSLFAQLFRQQFTKFAKELKEELSRCIDRNLTKVSLYTLINPDLITHSLRHSLATGNWGVSPRGDVIRHGVA